MTPNLMRRYGKSDEELKIKNQKTRLTFEAAPRRRRKRSFA